MMARRLLLSALLAMVGAGGAEAHSDAARSHSAACATLRACRSELAHARAAIRWQRSVRRGLERRLRYRWAPSSSYAIRLAALAYHIDAGAMLRVARCESNLDATAQNGRYLGLFQLGAPFMAATPFASFSRYDPLANALAAASVVRAQGWRQWTCRP